MRGNCTHTRASVRLPPARQRAGPGAPDPRRRRAGALARAAPSRRLPPSPRRRRRRRRRQVPLLCRHGLPSLRRLRRHGVRPRAPRLPVRVLRGDIQGYVHRVPVHGQGAGDRARREVGPLCLRKQVERSRRSGEGRPGSPSCPAAARRRPPARRETGAGRPAASPQAAGIDKRDSQMRARAPLRRAAASHNNPQQHPTVPHPTSPHNTRVPEPAELFHQRPARAPGAGCPADAGLVPCLRARACACACACAYARSPLTALLSTVDPGPRPGRRAHPVLASTLPLIAPRTHHPSDANAPRLPPPMPPGGGARASAAAAGRCLAAAPPRRSSPRRGGRGWGTPRNFSSLRAPLILPAHPRAYRAATTPAPDHGRPRGTGACPGPRVQRERLPPCPPAAARARPGGPRARACAAQRPRPQGASPARSF
jgi:hypothetical protein